MAQRELIDIQPALVIREIALSDKLWRTLKWADLDHIKLGANDYILPVSACVFKISNLVLAVYLDHFMGEIYLCFILLNIGF
jgi:hypothetical protein